ncbi:hypothetical protein DVH05_003644 [Phytophthora capsici]|nr:hypothetical protein DVH05_009671 [Phytophthora capsici]KAG1688439.1 hypothetical protein DVH05_003644 [Phytophthora capsici]
MKLSLQCAIVGQTGSSFDVEIDDGEKVNKLKEMIHGFRTRMFSSSWAALPSASTAPQAPPDVYDLAEEYGADAARKLSRILQSLDAAGFPTAHINSYSAFDRVLSGITWCNGPQELAPDGVADVNRRTLEEVPQDPSGTTSNHRHATLKTATGRSETTALLDLR